MVLQTRRKKNQIPRTNLPINSYPFSFPPTTICLSVTSSSLPLRGRYRTFGKYASSRSREMEAVLRLRILAIAGVAVVAASSLVQMATAADAPAPSPHSSVSAITGPVAFVASVSALAVGFLF